MSVLRENMVRYQIAARGVSDDGVLDAMRPGQVYYFQAVLPVQFDEYVWFDETRAVRAVPAPAREGVPDTYPFGV